MKNLITYLKTLWGAWGNLQSNDAICDRRLTVGSPSGFNHFALLKMVAVLALVLTVGVGQMWGTDVTFDATQDSGDGSITKDGVTVSMSTMNRSQMDNFRCNANSDMTVTSSNTITQIVVTCTGNGTNNYGPGKFAVPSGGVGSYTYQNSGKNGTWTGSATSITLHASAQVRITSIVVTYTASAASHTLSSAVSPAASGSVELSATSVAQGSTATATATPATHYVFDHWSISGTGSTLSSTTTNPTTVTMGTANTTVTANFVAAPKASITLSEAGATTTDASTYYVGDSYTLPSSTEASCGDKVLVGWSTAPVAETDTKPTSNFYEPGASATLTASQTFYAVFASVTEGTGDWEQCTSSTIADGDYLIVQSDYMMTNTLNSQRFNKTYIAISAGVISYDAKADWSAYTWHIAETSTSGIFTIKNGNNYVIGTGAASKIDLVSTPENNNELFAITYQSTPGTYKIESKYNEAASVNRWLRNGGSYFACYADGGYPYLFKRGSGYGNYCTTCAVTHTVSAVVNPAGKATVTLDATTVAEGSTTTATYSAITTGYEFVNWTITGTGASLSSTTTNPTTITMGTANVTVTANLQCITPSISVHPASKTDYIVGDVATALSVTANAGGASLSYQWQVSNNNSDWSNIAAGDGGTASTYTPSTAAAGTKYYRVKVTNAATGCSTNATSNAATITVTAASGYCISAFNSSNNGITSGFSNGGSGNEYTLSYTIPGKDGSSNWPQYWIGENEAWASFSANALFADMHFTHSDATLGLAEGATGKLHIWDDNKASGSNLWVKFEPDGYGFRWGGTGEWNQAANTKAFTVDPGNANTYWTEIVTLDGTNNTTWNYYVGLQSASGYVYSGVDNEGSDNRGVSRTRSVTTMKVSNGTAGSYKATNLNSEAAGTRGKFRIWDNNISDYNFVCHFVPYYRVTYNGSGASGSTAASADVCCEGNAAARTVKAAANGFTAATGKQFAGWATSAGGAKVYDPNDDIVLTADVVLYPVWEDIDYTVTVNQSPSVGATTTGQTTTAHYNGTINLTTTIPSGYRFVNWTTSDGFSITNSTSATTASFTMPNKNVTVTANFQQTHTVDWYVGGSAPANKIGDDGQTTVVDHGGKIEDFPAHDPDGSACEKTFVGWTNTSDYVHGTSPLFNDLAGSPEINTDASFYAVFAEVNSVSASLTKMTADDDLEVGDKIVIIAQDTRYGMYQASASSYVSYWTTTDVDGEPSLSEIEADDKKYLDVAAGSVTDTWKLGDAINGYLYNASSTNLEFSTTNSSDLTLTTWNDNTFTFRAGQYISCRTDITGTNANKWRGAGSSCNPENGNNCSGTEYYYLYKYVPGGTTATGHTINCTSCANSVTVSYSDLGSGNTMAVTKGSTPIASGTSVKTCLAVNLTVTLTPAAHFTADGLTATGVTGVTVSNVGNVYTVSIPADKTGTLTLTPTFTAETPLTITFIPTVAGATVGSIGTIYSGDDFNFPSVSNLPGGFCADFLGWVDFTGGETFDGDGTRTTAPSELITAGTNSGAITTDKTYKAVYGEPEDEEVEAYAKVTSSLADWSGTYLIVHEGSSRALDGSLGTSNIDAQGNYFSVTISDGKITGDHSTKHWTIAKIGETSTYTIKGASGCYIGRATTGNGLDKTTEAASAGANTISYSSGVTISGSGGPSLQYYSTSGQERFRYYASSQQAISLFKLGTTTVTTYTYTTAPSCGDKYRVTVTDVTGGSPSASPKYCADGTTISLVANPANGYSFTSWTITKDGTNPLQDVTSTLLGANSTTANTSFSMPDYDVTVTAAYSITNYNITYNNLNGATNSNPATYNVASADINFVAPGERSGYVFKGWYDDNVYTNAVTGIPNGSTGAVTVYAKWATGYTITWDNAIGSNPTSTGVEDGDPIGQLPTPTGSCSVDGTTYSNFVGWYTGTISEVASDPSDAGTLVTSATVPTASATYHAVYTNMPDYSETHTSNVTLPEQDTGNRIYRFKAKISDADDAEQYDAVKLGKSSPKTASFTITVPAGTTALTLHAVGWATTATLTVSTAAEGVTITPSAAQSLTVANASASDGTVYSSYNTFKFNLSGASSATTLTISNANERVMIWGINASSASGENVGYITQCCDNMLAAPTVTGTANSSTQITLSWVAVSGATGYKVSWNGGDWEDISTATSYVKTGLDPAETYSWKVMGKYNPASKCGAETASGTTTTKSVYHVTYAGGSGTGTCTASHVPTDNTAYEAGQTVTLPATSGEGAISLTGHQFAAWTSEQVALTASSTSFVMPESDVTVTAIWTAKVDKYYDNMHDLTATDPVTGDPGTQDGAHYYITREGCKYTVPSLSDNTTGATACHTTHYVLMGWVAASYMKGYPNNMDGTITEANKEHIFTGGGEKSATGATYYAVWAIVTE